MIHFLSLLMCLSTKYLVGRFGLNPWADKMWTNGNLPFPPRHHTLIIYQQSLTGQSLVTDSSGSTHA
jgi:hypothetical protein